MPCFLEVTEFDEKTVRTIDLDKIIVYYTTELNGSQVPCVGFGQNMYLTLNAASNAKVQQYVGDHAYGAN